MPIPYVSVVVAARNDDHGGDMLGRMQAFADSWIQQAERLSLASELLVVEWNPPSGRPAIVDALRWPSAIKHCRLRLITVPSDIHARFPNSNVVPLHQMIAKNVGIRRAAGQFILATNLDIVFSESVMHFLSLRLLEQRTLYRINRYDVPNNVTAYTKVEELLDSCSRQLLRIHAREGTFELSDGGCRKPDQSDIAAASQGVTLGRGWYPREGYRRGRFRWIEPQAELILDPPPRISRRLLLDVEAGPSAGSGVRLEIRDSEGELLAFQDLVGRRQLVLHMPHTLNRARIRFHVLGANLPLEYDPRFLNLRVFRLDWVKPFRFGVRQNPGETWRLEDKGAKASRAWAGTKQAPCPFGGRIVNAANLHTNACGDFTLLARDDWFSLRGYPEFPIWPMHIDSLFCYAAHHAGIRESVLEEPSRIYHIEHLFGAGWTPEGEHERTARIEAKKVPVIEYSELVRLISQMRRLNAPMIFNLDNWGLADQTLPETTI